MTTSKVPNRADFLDGDKGRNALFDRVDVLESSMETAEEDVEELQSMYRVVADDDGLLSVQAEVDITYDTDKTFNVKAVEGGEAGNGWEIIFVDPEAASEALDVDMDEAAKTVTISHATGEVGEIETTSDALETAFNAECTGILIADPGDNAVIDTVDTYELEDGENGLIAERGTHIYRLDNNTVYYVIGDLIEKDGENVVAADFRKIDTEASGLT